MRLRFAWLALPLAGALAACAAAQKAEPQAGISAAGPWDRVAFTTSSWGRPLSSWEVGSTGEGRWSEGIGSGRANERLDHHTLEVGAEGFAQLAALVAKVPVPAPSHEDCKTFMTDQPYGTLRLTRGATTIELAYNKGCREGEYGRFLATLEAADALVAGWGKAAPVSYSEPAAR